MTKLVEGKVALVTGGASGIGRATTLVLAREGARVLVADVDVEGGRETVDLVERDGGVASFVRADTSRWPDAEAMVRAAVEQYGRLDCAFNNAGIGSSGAVTHEEVETDFDRIVAINLKGVWLCMKAELVQMLEQGGGVIVNTASVAGLVGLPRGSSYAAAKHGVVGLTRTAALEYAQRNVRINAVCPGLIRTPLTARTVARHPEREAMLINSEPIGRWADPSEVAEAVVWLCSDRASFVTGTAMTVDGAWTAQ